MKGKVYRTVVRPAMLYGLETVALSKRQEAELEVAELKMLRFLLGVMRMDKIRNEFIRGTAHVGRFGDKVKKVRLRWFGHVQRRDMGYIGRRMLRMEPPGRRKRGRPRRRFMDVVRWHKEETLRGTRLKREPILIWVAPNVHLKQIYNVVGYSDDDQKQTALPSQCSRPPTPTTVQSVLKAPVLLRN
ncbi:hypothetical protein ACOMIB_19320 [Bacillus sp. YIM B13582]|uniref:hypothetical protein n=1 Tax=Bacillus sp. YIM B13582 TaxID=3366876 RepID=UPI003B7E3A39